MAGVAGRSTESLGVMPIGYAWSCKFCGGSNPPDADSCALCGKAAIARPVEVDHAKGAAGLPSLKSVARAHETALLRIFFAVMGLAIAFFVLDRYWFHAGDVWGWPLLFLSLPFGLIFIPLGLGINAVITTVLVMWWIEVFRRNNDA